MSIFRNILLTALTLCLSLGLEARNINVTGKVTDSSTGEPIPFASIQVKGTMTGGSTDYTP